ncbi:hypothetical protein CKO28_03130 [Rhodovibrio sodomensis]|uniref:Uncharacterized protein n=1 Tax=Rhodovibrio sodomensis TaxID=1088 RepID=A0ABS1DA87_9PROT|nr:hypothetical protein [Rhodovibrio sodomensis]MBK1667037.1 hypothetical protein [Rhodovibrio sodomensis]
MQTASRIAELEVGSVFTESAPLKSRLVAILAPTRSLRKMARTTRQRVASDIRRSLKERQT